MNNFDYNDYIRHIRRKVHANPEMAYKEIQTQKLILAELENLSLSIEKIGTGVVARLLLGKPYTVAFRADMDALPITEQNQTSYKSVNDGCMHACGHDGHVAVLLAFAKFCASNPDKMQSNAVFIFQPAEEAEGGAISMIEGGALNGVDEIFAIHVDPSQKAGIAGLRSGASMAGALEFDLEFKGESSHCAEKHLGKDALRGAMEAITGIYDSIPKNIKDKTIFHVGKITGGYARNVVADTVIANCTIRYFEENHLASLTSLIDCSLKLAADKFGIKAKLLPLIKYVPLINHSSSINKVKKHINSVDIDKKYTAEDFAFYLQKVKGCIIWLGVNTGESTKKLHSPDFDFDEDALTHGFTLFQSLIKEKTHG